MSNVREKLFWGIAFPGFAQFLNGKIFKGTVLILLEFVINVQANMNQAIISSFHGDIRTAIAISDYQWLLFYPCVYLFAIWDGYRDAGGGKEPYSFLPFVFSAYFGTIGVIYSPSFAVMDVLFGPIWLGILGMISGVGIGFIVKVFLSKIPANRRQK